MSLETHQQGVSSNNSNNGGVIDNSTTSRLHEPSNSVDVSVENTLYKLEEIDELLREDNSSTQNALLDFLRSEEHLEDALAEENTELRAYCDEFVKMHELRAEDICNLYNSFNECEERLVSFETGIIEFQHQLEDTADSIAKMQQQTDEVILGVRHRKEVSDKISEVYSALQECDVYCQAIRQNEVDDAYLDNLQELGHKLSFLINNKALQHSAVDDEIRPKLISAAVKAGKKLERYLSQWIISLVNDMSHIAQQQEFLEERAHFAFRFLQLYNQPVAIEITRQYLRTMSEDYQRPFRAITHTLLEINAISMPCLQPIITVEQMYEVMCNRDAWSPAGNYVNVPPPQLPPLYPGISAYTPESRHGQFRQPSNNLPTRSLVSSSSSSSASASWSSTSVSSSHKHHKSQNNNNNNNNNSNKGVMGKLSTLNPIPSLQSSFAQLGHGSDEKVNKGTATSTNNNINTGGSTKLTSRSLPLLRPCTFIDVVHTLLGATVRYGSLHFDDEYLHELNASNSWVWRFTATLINVVNNMVRECRFIGNFFCQAVHVEGGEDFGKAETLAHAVLHTSLDIVRTSLLECVKVTHDRNSTLAALRVLEIVKQYLCTSLDPIPLLLFSETIGSVKRVLSNNLYSVLEYDELVLAEIGKLDLKPFRSTPVFNFTNSNNINSKTETASTSVNASGHVNTLWSLLTREKNYLVTLTPHELVCSIAQLLAELEQLNVLHLQSLTFVQDSNVCFDRRVTLFVSKGVEVILIFVHELACRHSLEHVQCIFMVVNLYVVQLIWAHTFHEIDVELQGNNNEQEKGLQGEETSGNSGESMLISDTETNLPSPASPFSENDEEDIKNSATSNASALLPKSDHCCKLEEYEYESKQKLTRPSSEKEKCTSLTNRESANNKHLTESNSINNKSNNRVDANYTSVPTITTGPYSSKPLPLSSLQVQEMSTKRNDSISIITEALHSNLLRLIELELAHNTSINSMQKVIETSRNITVDSTDNNNNFKVQGNNTLNYTELHDQQEQKESQQLEERRCQEEESSELETECDKVESNVNVEEESLHYDDLCKTAEEFHSSWQTSLQHFYYSMHLLLTSIFNVDTASINTVWIKEMSPSDKLTQLLTRLYVQRLLQLNSQFAEVVQKKCKLQNKSSAEQKGRNSIRSMLVSNTAIMHEAQRLSSLTPPEANI